MNKRVLVSCLVVVWGIASIAHAENFHSADDIRFAEAGPDDEENPCPPVFDPNLTTLFESECEACSAHIAKFAKPEDRGLLLRELAQLRLSGDSGLSCDVAVSAFPEKDAIEGVSFFMDQDAIVLDEFTDLNEDRNYTLGLGLSITGGATKNWFPAGWLRSIDKRIGIYKLSDSNPLETVHSFDFGMTAFTPGDLEDEDPIPGDRPHAALIFISASKQTAYNDGHAVKSRLVLGVLGLDVAKDLQRYLHNDVGLSKKDPRGWANQISDGGELTALYAIEGTKLMREKRGGWLDYDVSFTASGSVGYYTDVAFGGDFRLGRITSPYYAHSANPLSVYNHGNCIPCAANDSYFFASYRARIVLYNALLQGQFRDNPIEFEAGDLDRLLHEAGIGYTYHFTPGYQLTYALNYKSPEFFGEERRSHWWGGLYMSWNFAD
ncbi:MAG: lipid A deacylase LpxR family protein [Pseudomonadota bacterium]